MSKLDVHFSSKTDEWATPQWLFDELNAKYGPLELDVCADENNHKCEIWYSKESDGLSQPWDIDDEFLGDKIYRPAKCWMNPPYSKPEHICKKNCQKKKCIERGHHQTEYKPGIGDWVKKAYEESQRGCLVICLLPARTDTKFFHKYCLRGKIEFLEGRLKFGDAKNAAPFPSMIVVFEPPK
jgi:phage N-6-adenine-methyltransferase